MDFIFFNPDEHAEETRQRIEQIERTWHELSANAHNKGTAKRLKELEAEHAELAKTLPPEPTPLEVAIEQQIEVIRSAQIQATIQNALQKAPNEDGEITFEDGVAALEALKASQPDPKADGGFDT